MILDYLKNESNSKKKKSNSKKQTTPSGTSGNPSKLIDPDNTKGVYMIVGFGAIVVLFFVINNSNRRY